MDNRILRMFSQAKELIKFKYYTKRINTSLDSAVDLIEKRRQDSELRKTVSDFLKSDIPLHFNGRLPIFYLSRYIATPDYETLKFYEQVKRHDFPIVIGEDTTDIFTTHSSLKRNLLKLPIVTGTAKDGSGILKYKNIADFNNQQGKKLRDITLHDHSSLYSFHRRLSKKFLPESIHVADESEWVNRHSRGKLLKLYEYLLPLFLTHGIMLEQYEPDEVDFLEEVVWPAFKNTKKRFGLTPLIVPLNLKTDKKIEDLNSYPAEVEKYVQEIMKI